MLGPVASVKVAVAAGRIQRAVGTLGRARAGDGVRPGPKRRTDVLYCRPSGTIRHKEGWHDRSLCLAG